MSNAVPLHPEQPLSPALSSLRLIAALVFGVWFALVVFLGAREVFVAPRGTPPLSLLTAFTLPVVVFLFAYWRSPEFREFVLNADLRFLTGMQAWRFAGFSFLALLTYGILPGYFAWPAGIGGMGICVNGPLNLVALNCKRKFASGYAFF